MKNTAGSADDANHGKKGEIRLRRSASRHREVSWRIRDFGQVPWAGNTHTKLMPNPLQD